MMYYPKHLWCVFHEVVLSVLWEVTVGDIAYYRLHMTEYVFPDVYGQKCRSQYCVHLLQSSAHIASIIFVKAQ
jgi:hypothetical protein